MYDYAKGNLHTFFDKYFTLNSKIRKHNTRSTNSIHKKGNRTNYGKFSIKYTGTKIWNGIPKSKRFMYKKEIQNGNENIFVVSRQTITS